MLLSDVWDCAADSVKSNFISFNACLTSSTYLYPITSLNTIPEVSLADFWSIAANNYVFKKIIISNQI
jgi:hypothetical protein